MRIFVWLLLGLFCVSAQASPEAEAALTRFNQIKGDAVLRAQALQDGEDRIRFCGHCHGHDGNSKRDHIPNLAEQNPIYLFNAFEKFAKGERTDFVMSKLAQNLTLEDRVNIALYYGEQKVLASTEPADPVLQAQGQVLFQKTCIACHGAQAQGLESMPRLAGQSAAYVRNSLTRFRNNDPSRAGSVMLGIASTLSPSDINALAAYLEHLQVQ